MSSTKDLFGLISGLTANEKRYLKRLSLRHKDASGPKGAGDSVPKYIQLFNLFDKFRGGEEALEKLDKLIITSGIIKNRKHLPQERKYLEEKILESMRVYHAGKGVEVQLHNLMQDQAFLYQKGLYEHSQRMLDRAKDLAIQFDKFSISLDLLVRERRLVLERKSKKLAAYLLEIEKGREDAQESQRAYFTHLHHSQLVFSVLRTETYKEVEGDPLSSLLHGIDPDYYESDTTPRSYITQHLFLYTRGLFARLESDFHKCKRVYREHLEHLKSRPDRIKEEPNYLKIALSNYLGILHKLQQYEEFEEVLTEIKNIKAKTFDEKAETFQNIAFYRLLYFMNTSQFKAAHTYISSKEFQKDFETYGPKINPARRGAFWHNQMIICFIMEDHGQAIQWVNTILDHPNSKGIRVDIYHFARIMELILRFVQEAEKNEENFDEDFLKERLRNARRHLFRHDRSGDYYVMVLKYLSLLFRTPESDRKQVYQAFHRDLKEFMTRNKTVQVIGSSELLKWLIHREEGRPLKELFQ